MKRKFLFVLLAALTCIGANAALKRQNNYLEFSGEVTATAGKEVVVNILMTNNLTITSWQTELVLPAGVTFVKAESTESWTDEISVSNNVLFSETDNAAAAGQKVAVAKVTLKVDASVAAGEYEIALDKIVMTASDESTIAQTGDLTGDDKVNAADIQALLNIIAAEEFNAAADLTGDSKVNAADIQALLNIIAAQ